MALEPEESPLPPLPPLPPLSSVLVTTARSPLSPTLTDTVQYKEKFCYGEHVTFILEKWMDIDMVQKVAIFMFLTGYFCFLCLSPFLKVVCCGGETDIFL